MKPILLLFLLSSCMMPFKSQRMTRTELFFGLSKPDGGIIAAQDWQAFADTVISKTFPDGSTLVDARGQWLGTDGKTISESSKILILVSKMNASQTAKIEEVRNKYKKYFQQEAVLRVDDKVRVGF
jgi:Protein of unknown function (DUF3574)